MYYNNVLDLIGNTPLMCLQESTGYNIFAKAEFLNPGGSIKDRIAKNMIETAEAEGKLKPGMTIIEPTSGNTGIGLALVGVRKGYEVIIVMPENMSEERKKVIQAFGAKLVLTEPKLSIGGAVDKANEIASANPEKYYMPQQFVNPANPEAHYRKTAVELSEQLGKKIDIYVSGVGSGGTLQGIAKYLLEQNPDTKIVAVEPKGVSALHGDGPGIHQIQGIGDGFIPDVLDTGLITDVVEVSDEDAINTARKLAKEQGLTFVHPFDDLDVATGQGSIAMEIIKELPTVDYILVPIGGGGLATGVSTLAKLLNPNIKVIGVEPAGANCLQESLKEGKVITLPTVNTIADGTAVKTPGSKLFPYLQKNLDSIITVPDEDLIVAFLDMVENHKMIVENSGLLTVAALKQMNVKDKKIVSILSGGNMDVITMSSVVQQGLVQRSRIFTVSVLLPDKPGELVRVASIIAEANGNVIKLEHNQFVSINRKATVELRITIEAFGHEHKDEIVDKLEAAGLRPRIVKVNI